MCKIILVFLAITIVFSCNQKKEEQLNDSVNVEGYKIVPVATTNSNSDESKYQLISKVVDDSYKNGIVKDSKHKLEFFFYCSNEQQAKQLTDHLNYMTYTAKYQRSVDNTNSEFVVMGYTTPFPINADAIFGWSKGMDQIAEKYNSEFDGWQVAIK